MPPTVTASADVAICFGDNTDISAAGSGGTGALTYTWMPGTLTGATVNVTPTTTTTYTVTVEDELGCTSTDEVTVTVNDNPLVTLTKDDATCEQDNGAVFVGITGGAAPYQYNW